MDATKVMVTGASGFVGAEITRQLLARGYHVMATTRDVGKARAQGHLTSLPGADQRLELHQADLLSPGDYDDAVEGCVYALHVASPYVLNVEDPQRDLVDPAVKGTLSVLESAARTPTVRRVVLTSSFVAMQGPPEGKVFSEADWNTVASLGYQAYDYSKTMAERAAWQYVETRHPEFDLVAINPTSVIGPSLIPARNESHGFFVSLTDGTQPGILPFDFPFVDVRDVALAHILAMESPLARGRYIATAGTSGPVRFAEIAREMGLDQRYRIPRLRLDGPVGSRVARLAVPLQPKGTRDFLRSAMGRHFVLDNTKIRRELGMVFRDLDETIRDTWLDLERWGHLGRTRKAAAR
ncbi:MAG: aldehyde reductase [Actinobacteria bacterium]|nr:aldehyde reductase [Actinomycetota bacterium]